MNTVRLFHRHRWEDVGEPRFVPGVMDRGGEVSGGVGDKVVYGYTEIPQRCVECGKPRVASIVGRYASGGSR